MVSFLATITISLPESLRYGTLLHFAFSLAVCLHLLSKPRDARTSLLWIFFTTAFPVIGPLAYVLFGINTIPSKSWKKQSSDQIFQKRQKRTIRLNRFSDSLPVQETAPTPSSDNGMYVALNLILDQLSRNHPLLDGNKVQLIESAEQALEEMFHAIHSARKHIHLSTYIFNDDRIGQRLMSILVERAQSGVHVRVLYDAFGSAGANLRLFFWRHRHVPNLHIIGFSQANMLKRKFQLNLRNHRKLLIIDGTCAFTGGVNFHDVYLPHDSQPGTIDYHFKLRGPAVLELQYTFLRDWYYMTDEPTDKLLDKTYFPDPEYVGGHMIRLQNSGPTQDETGTALDTFFAAINLARKQILIVTPYFVPPEALILALRQAAFRGVDVKVLVPSVNNHPTLRFASHALYTSLLIAGVRIYERQPPFIHAKAAIFDDAVSIFGSVNFDPRSFFLNYETNLVVFNADFAARVKSAILNDLSYAQEILYAEWLRRPKLTQLVENFFNLFHPIA
ncbi:MAG: cardiolipin synthase [bacterium]